MQLESEKKINSFKTDPTSRMVQVNPNKLSDEEI